MNNFKTTEKAPAFASLSIYVSNLLLYLKEAENRAFCVAT